MDESTDALPQLACDLEIDRTQLDQLGLFDRGPPSRTGADAYRDQRQQLLAAGESLGAKLQGRIKRAQFGRHRDGDHACLVVLALDFKPGRYTGILRFREATVEVQVYPGQGDGTEDGPAGDQDADGPFIADWYPRYYEGPARSTREEFHMNIEADAVPLAGGASLGPDVGYSVSRERETRRRIHGTLEGDAERVVEWRLEENNSIGDSVPPSCDVALLVRWPRAASFHLRMRIRGIIVAGIPVVGHDKRAVYFTADSAGGSYAGPAIASRCITGGIVGSGQDIYAHPDRGQGHDADDSNDPTTIPLDGLIDIAEQFAQE